MRRVIVSMMLILSVLALMCGGAGAVSSSEMQLMADFAQKGIDTFFRDWYYVSNTVPAPFGLWDRYEMIGDRDTWQTFGAAWDPEITFVSGDPALDGAVILDPRENFLWIGLNQLKLTRPGSAVFHIRIGSDQGTVLECDRTLFVVNYEDYPLLDLKRTNCDIEVPVGSMLNFQEIQKMLFVPHREEITEAFRPLREGWEVSEEDFLLEEMSGVNWNPDMFDLLRPDEKGGPGVRVIKGGTAEQRFSYRVGNISFGSEIVFRGARARIQGQAALHPGDEAAYTVTGALPERTFTWSVRGEGASVDAETGVLTVAEDTPAETLLTLKATPDDGDPVSMAVIVSPVTFSRAEYTMAEQSGFRIPIPGGDDWKRTVNTKPGKGPVFTAVSPDKTLKAEARIRDCRYLLTDEENLRREYNAATVSSRIYSNIRTSEICADGCLVRLVTYDKYSGGKPETHLGDIIYGRDTQILIFHFESTAVRGVTENGPRTLTMEMLRELAMHIGYDYSAAPITAADGQVMITEKSGIQTAAAGSKLQFIASFPDPKKVNGKEKYNNVRWGVKHYPDTENEAEGMDPAKGILLIPPDVEEPMGLRVTVRTSDFGTYGYYYLQVVPKARSVTAEPAEIFFYTGDSTPQIVKAAAEPDSVPGSALTWKAGREGIVTVHDNGDGTATLTPTGAGKTTLTVSAPGGESTKVNITVTEPVTAVELSAKGKAKPGKTVTVTAALSPKNAGNKTVEWSVDADPSVASIDGKGRLAISKEAAPGTVITVTCTAPGAPEPVTADLAVTVE